MSEYQCVMFQAVDRPLNDNQLKYAQRQSTRADVSRWSLSVEYHYSSFRGDVEGLLRRGYDVFLQHTNYGDREIKMRLPHGMPVAKSVWSQYVDGEKLGWKKDAKGRGGILSLHPFHETGELEEVWETQKYLDAVCIKRNNKNCCRMNVHIGPKKRRRSTGQPKVLSMAKKTPRKKRKSNTLDAISGTDAMEGSLSHKQPPRTAKRKCP